MGVGQATSEKSHGGRLKKSGIKRLTGCLQLQQYAKSRQRAANPESELIAKNGKVPKTPSLLSDSRREFQFAQKIFRSPDKKVRACFLQDTPIQDSACRLRRECNWSTPAYRPV